MKTNVTRVTIAVFVATFMTAIEGTIVTTAMPTIVGSLHGIEIMNWVFSIYLLTSAMLTPIYGKLADNIGRKPIFLFGTLLFMIGSGLCGLSNSMLTLILSRAVQGIGAGAMMPVALTIIADLYPVEKRAKVLGLNSTAWGIASVVGPLAGGLIVDTIGWHWIFFINVPIGAFLIGMIWLYFHEEKKAKKTEKMDLFGSFLMMATLVALLLGFQLLGDQGISISVVSCLVLAIVALFFFYKVEKKATDPLIDLALFQSRTFVVVNLVAALASGFLMGIDVYIPMWMQGVLGMSAGIGGLVLAPLSILWMVGSFLASRWLTKQSVSWVLTTSLLITLVGAIWLFITPMKTTFIWFLGISSITGIGLGATMVVCTVTAQTSVPQSQIGVATSFNTLLRTIGQTIMVSVFGIVLNISNGLGLEKSGIHDQEVMNQLVDPVAAKQLSMNILLQVRAILYDGLHWVYGVGLVLILIALVFARTIRRESGTIIKKES
jgi:EmrB/QacA subfamily drug resistance transporter